MSELKGMFGVFIIDWPKLKTLSIYESPPTKNYTIYIMIKINIYIK